MKTLILLRGLPGSGKSSLASLLTMLSPGFFTCYAADDWLEDEYGEYRYGSKPIDECHHQCQQAVEFDMADSIGPIIVHNTMTREKEIEPYLLLSKKYGYQVISLVVENRHDSKSVHSVPDTTLEKMRRRFSIKL